MTAYQSRYMIADSQNEPLARAILETPPNNPVWQIRVLDHDLEQVLDHEIINLIPMNLDAPSMTGRILSSDRVDLLTLEPVDSLGDHVRQNLRVPVRFDSFIYPISGNWKGRLPIISHDLSCGGIAFFCNFQLRIAEVVELVVPITSQPLILKTQILRLRPAYSNIPLYSAKFVDMIHDEEVLVRESVFSQQIQNQAARR